MGAGAEQTELDRLVADLVRRHGQPGLVVGVLRDGCEVTAAAGSANLRYGAPMTVQTGFLTGSITKVWMTSLVMTFVEEGALSLDDPVRAHLPWVQMGRDPALQDWMTIRTLLSHSSGIDAGDYILDTGPYPLGVEPYVKLLADVEHLHEPGRFTSYNNAGWLVVELVLRALSGRDFHTLLRERVLTPLGLDRTVFGPAEAILHPIAVGHLPLPHGGGHEATPTFLLPDCFAAAGTTLVTTVQDTLRFLRMHLRYEQDILSSSSLSLMQRPCTPDPSGPQSGFGLGWRYTDTDGLRVLHHGGGSYGGLAFAVISPEEDFAYAAFANSSDSMGMHAELQQALTGRPATFAVATVDEPARSVDASPMLGTFLRKSQRVDVARDHDGLTVTISSIETDIDAAGYDQGQPTALRADVRDARSAVTREPANQGIPFVLTFLDPDEQGRFTLLYMGGRIARRVTDG